MAGLLTRSLSANAFPKEFSGILFASHKGYIQQRDCLGFSPNSLFNQVYEPIAFAKLQIKHDSAKEKL